MLPLTYFLKVMLCTTAFFGYYLIALRNKKFHQYNRFYLLFSVVASWLIPLIKFQIDAKQNVQQPIYQAFSYIAESNTAFEFEPNQQIATSFNWMQLVPVLYVTIAIIILMVFIVSLLRVYRIYKKYPKQKTENIVLLHTTEDGTPFSFFKYIFWNDEIDANSTAGKQILQHELTHVQEKHSWDKIFIQINLVFGWFNPCFWLIKKELEMIHEFIADNKAVADSNVADFASMLLVATFPTHQYKLTNPFFFSPIKRRLVMLTQNKNPKFSYLRRVVVLPLLATIVLLFAFRKKEIAANFKTEKKYKVVIDAGHGGDDFGCKSVDGNVYEKDIDLAIAKAIKQLNNNKNIEIVLTRNDDRFDDVKAKAEFINKQNADVCVSIHCSDAGKSEQANGTEIYVVSPEKNNGFMNESNALAQSVNGFIKNDFVDRGIKTNKQGIWILQATKCPVILVEAGFLSNRKDAEMLQKADKQVLIATDILKGIENYLTTPSNIKKSNSVLNYSSKATAEEMTEYLKLTEKYKKQLKKYMGYNFENISKAEEDRMFAIFCKMNKEQQETLHVYFVPPVKPSIKSVPTKQQLNNWATNKAYGVWIDDGKQVSNSELLKHSPLDFSNFSISKLEKNAINYGKHYYQVDLMTNKYYDAYVKRSSEQKYLLCWGAGLKTSLFAKANKRLDKEISE